MDGKKDNIFLYRSPAVIKKKNIKYKKIKTMLAIIFFTTLLLTQLLSNGIPNLVEQQLIDESRNSMEKIFIENINKSGNEDLSISTKMKHSLDTNDYNKNENDKLKETKKEGLSDDDIKMLQKQGEIEGWTFTVGKNSATNRSLDQLCGAIEPENWQDSVKFNQLATDPILPETFDWRALGGCTSIKNQGSWGSCWAFSTVAPLECNILIKDNIEVDLSEQWLISCNRDGWDSNGGWFAHDYHEWKTDYCGDTGAVLEQYSPYVGYKSPCNCPYLHDYFINELNYIGSSNGIPSVSAIKQTIMNYGPVSAAVCSNAPFQSYNGGVFNSCTSGSVSHLITLVGWDDTQGSNGVWILRNSWGTGWGVNGYMLIEYGCSSVGYGACYVDYSGSNNQNSILS